MNRRGKYFSVTAMVQSWLALLPCMVWLSVSQAGENDVQLRLKNGDFVIGQLVSASEPGLVAIRSTAFEQPVQVSIDAVSSIDMVKEPVGQAAQGQEAGNQWQFVLSNNATVVGKLVQLDDKVVKVVSASLGEVEIDRSMLTEIIAQGRSVKTIFTGPTKDQLWKSVPKEDAWRIDTGSLSTARAGQIARCEATLLPKFEVRLTLSWSANPSFMLAIGASKVPAERDQTKPPAALYLETWEDTLTLVREIGGDVDFVSLGRLAPQSRVNLLLYVDQDKGEVHACTPVGAPLGSVRGAANKQLVDRSFIQLLNSGENGDRLRLERLDIREWNGRLPNQASPGNEGVVVDGGEIIRGQVQALDTDGSSVQLAKDDQTTASVSMATIERILFQGQAVTVPSEKSVRLQLADQSSCIGTWKSSTEGKFAIEMEGIASPLTAKIDQFAGLAGNSTGFKNPDRPGRRGQLENDHIKLTGCLDETSDPGHLLWRADVAAASAKIDTQFAGKVVYGAAVAEPLVAGDVAAEGFRPARARPANLALPIPGIQIFMGNGRAAVPESDSARAVRRLEGGLKFRSGDAVQAKVLTIDEKGVTFQLGDQTRFVPHEKMESTTLVGRALVNDIPANKLKQLMTVPRAAKLDPPTHLFVGVNGDYLRGRLVKYADDCVTAEIRLENVTFKPGAIVQIYWLHSRDWDVKSKDQASESAKAETVTSEPKVENESASAKQSTAVVSSSVLQVHARQRSGKAITFSPTAVVSTGEGQEQILKGDNELVGPCEVRIMDLSVLLIGRDVGALAREMQKDAWKLSLAQSPKVYQEGGNASEVNSPLIGKPAPDFTLPKGDGGQFTLSRTKGRVIVLDFWASWCGPCMQTMPEIDRIVHEIGAGEIELIAMNQQESKERAMATIKRLGCSATVVLDEEGTVGAEYQAVAIPQTVIINREGVVTNVFVGGPRFLEQFKEALSNVLGEAN